MTAVLLALFSAAGYRLSDFLYLHCMISPIRGDFTGFGFKSPSDIEFSQVSCRATSLRSHREHLASGKTCRVTRAIAGWL